MVKIVLHHLKDKVSFTKFCTHKEQIETIIICICMCVVTGHKRAFESDDGCEADIECEEPSKKRQRLNANNAIQAGESTLEKMTIAKCGDTRFIRKLSSPFLQLAEASGADLNKFRELLQKNHNTFIGTPEENLSYWTHHLRRQMQENQVGGVVKEIIERLIQSGNLKGASISLESTLKYQRNNPQN